MPNGGTLRITADISGGQLRPPTDIAPGSYLRLSVVDTGSGMDQETLARAVEPFFSTKGVGKGTGLGLSMVHGLASQLGGALTIRSRVGVGTHVELWLQVSDQRQKEIGTISANVADRKTSGSVLLVDDEAIARMTTTVMLGDLSYDVLEAESAEAALALVEKRGLSNLLVSDHLTPGLSGTELARLLQSRAPEMRVLIVLGYSEVEDIAPDLPRLTKPFRQEELASALT